MCIDVCREFQRASKYTVKSVLRNVLCNGVHYTSVDKCSVADGYGGCGGIFTNWWSALSSHAGIMGGFMRPSGSSSSTSFVITYASYSFPSISLPFFFVLFCQCVWTELYPILYIVQCTNMLSLTNVQICKVLGPPHLKAMRNTSSHLTSSAFEDLGHRASSRLWVASLPLHKQMLLNTFLLALHIPPINARYNATQYCNAMYYTKHWFWNLGLLADSVVIFQRLSKPMSQA